MVVLLRLHVTGQYVGATDGILRRAPVRIHSHAMAQSAIVEFGTMHYVSAMALRHALAQLATAYLTRGIRRYAASVMEVVFAADNDIPTTKDLRYFPRVPSRT